MVDYSYWHERLAGEDVPHPDDPQPGRYRLPARLTAPSSSPGQVRPPRPPVSHPVAIWPDPESGKLVVKVGTFRPFLEDTDRYLEFVGAGWPRCLPVTREQYDLVLKGGSWPDEHDAVTRSNNAPPEDSFEGLQAAIEDLAREAQALVTKGAAQTQEESDRAADLANRLGELQKKADKKRREEKIPHESAAKAVDDRWRPMLGAAEIYSRLKQVVCAPFLKRQREEAERAKFAALTTGTPEAALPPTKHTAGSRGRPVALRTEKHAVIEDIDVVFAAFKNNPDVRELLTKLATKAVRAGATVPGVRVHEQDRAA